MKTGTDQLSDRTNIFHNAQDYHHTVLLLTVIRSEVIDGSVVVEVIIAVLTVFIIKVVMTDVDGDASG